jgi:uncharacterized protein YdcH (DUF465 family)
METEMTSPPARPEQLPHPACDMSESSQSLSMPDSQSNRRVSLPNPYAHIDSSRASLPSPYAHIDSSRASLPSTYTHVDSRVSLPNPYVHTESRVSLPSPYMRRHSRSNLPCPSDQDIVADHNSVRDNLTNPNSDRDSLVNQKAAEVIKPKLKTTALQKKDSIYSRLAKKKPKSLTFSMPSGKLSRYERDRAIIQHSSLTAFPSKPLPLHNNNNNNNNFNKNNKNGPVSSNRCQSNKTDVNNTNNNSAAGNSGSGSNNYQHYGLCTMKEGL